MRPNNSIGAVAVVMVLLAGVLGTAFAANIGGLGPRSAGSGVQVSEGYVVGTNSLRVNGGSWTAGNNTETNAGTVVFTLSQQGGAQVTSADTQVYAQLTGGTASNWVQCSIPTASNVSCDFFGSQKSMASVTGISVVAQGDNVLSITPPEDPEPLSVQFVASDGTLDTGFNPGTGASSTVYSFAVQPDGKIIIGGGFTSYNGTGRNRIARVNTDGSLDATFNPGTGADNPVERVAVQPDGKVLIVGAFTAYNGTARSRIARVNTDGSLDTSFDPGTGAQGFVRPLAVQPDGKIIIGGGFTAYNGTARSHIARVNTDGSLDATFNPGAGANNTVTSVTVQPDGKVLIGGAFTSYDGTARNRIARLNANGSLDISFDPGAGATFNPAVDVSGDVTAIAVQPDGKVLIVGSFTSYDGTARNRIARVNTDGSLDATFNPGAGADNSVNAVGLQPDGKIIITGSFTSYGPSGVNVGGSGGNGIQSTITGTAQYFGGGGGGGSGDSATRSLGSLGGGGQGGQRTSGAAGAGQDGTNGLGGGGGGTGGINQIGGRGGSGAVIVRYEIPSPGDCPATSSLATGGVITIIEDGGDCYAVHAFSGAGTSNFVALEPLNVEYLIVAGGGGAGNDFSGGGGGGGVRSGTTSIQAQSYSIVVGAGGAGAQVVGTTSSGASGGNSSAFGLSATGGGLGANWASNGGGGGSGGGGGGSGGRTGGAGTAGQGNSGGNGGAFLTGAGGGGGAGSAGGVGGAGSVVTRNRIARVNTDGTLDATFNPGTGANNVVVALVLQPDGKIMIGGGFTTYGGTARNHIARLGTGVTTPPPVAPLGSTFDVLTLDGTDGAGLAIGVSSDSTRVFVGTNATPSRAVQYTAPGLTGRSSLQFTAPGGP